MNHNQLLSLRVNSKLLRENVEVAPLVPVLLADNVIREVYFSFLFHFIVRQCILIFLSCYNNSKTFQFFINRNMSAL